MLNIIQEILFLVSVIICVIAKIRNIRNKGQEEVYENRFIEKYCNILFLAILSINSISIFYKIGSIPQGLHVDEAGALYDAICISKYGVDRYLYKLPVYLINFGGGQSALYAYLVAIMIKVFDISIITLRLPSAILSLISCICLYTIIKESYGKKQALFAAFVLALCPWNIMKTRWGLDCNLMSSMLIISTYILTKALNSKKQYLYVISGIFWGLTLYTYVISYLIVPIILGIILSYALIIKQVNIKNVICLAIPLIILAIPLVLMIAYNNEIIPKVNIPICSIPKLWYYRGSEISLKNIPKNLNSIFEILFIRDFLNYNAIPEFGTLYKLSIPLVIFGFIEVVKNTIEDVKQKKFIAVDFIMLVTFVVELCIGLCIAELNINKLNAIYIPMIYFASKFFCSILNNIKYLALVILILYCLNYSLFIRYYFTEFSNTDLMYFEDDIIEASKRAEELQKEKIYVENCLNQTYIYTLVANPISPYEFNQNLKVSSYSVFGYGKYDFQVPQEINKNAVYIIKEDTQKIKQLMENEFKMEQYGDFTVLWYGN